MYPLRVAARLIPVLLAVSTGIAVTLGDPAHFAPTGMALLFGPPALAWGLLAPDARIACAGGLVAVPLVAMWTFDLTHSSGFTTPSDEQLGRWYPVGAGLVVLAALGVVRLLRQRRPGRRPGIGTWLRIGLGTAVLLATSWPVFAWPSPHNDSVRGAVLSTCDSPARAVTS